jgi:hypothetical protein
MSEPTSTQKIRIKAVEVVAGSMLERGYGADAIVEAADMIAKFVVNGEVPPKLAKE